jgi:predicted DNA-binding transcriptional regulator AlpA
MIRTRCGIKQAEQISGLHRQSIWRRTRAGTFPAPHYIANRRMWFVDELERWASEEMAQQAESRRGASNLHAEI